MAEIPTEVDLDSVIDLDTPAGSAPPSTKIEKVLSIEEIRSMIAQLSVTEDGEPLKGAMDELKKGIKDNPAACDLLLPEDVGAMVKAIYRMTDRDLEKATEKASKSKGRKSSQPKLDLSDKNVQQEILDDL